MNPDTVQPRRFPRRVPHLLTEPVIRDMAVSVARTRRPGVILAFAAAGRAVVRVGTPAMLAPAFRRVVRGEGAVPVLAAFLVRLGHTVRGRGGIVARPFSSRLRGWLVGEQQIIVPEAIGCDVCCELCGDLLAELEPPVFLVFGVVLDQE